MQSGLGGYEVAAQIRQNPVLKHVILVALTGYGQDADQQTSLEAGFDHHAVKPARLEQVKEILATASERVGDEDLLLTGGQVLMA